MAVMSIILKYMIAFLLICMVIKKNILTSSENIGWKMRRKSGTNGPIYTYVKTDKHANIKWGVRHYVPRTSKMMKRADDEQIT